MQLTPNKNPLGWACLVLFLFLSCGRRDILIDPAPTTTTQQTPTGPSQDRDTPLHEAISAQTDLASLYPFLQPTSINQPDNEGNTPLHRAVIQDNLPLIGLLLSAKANIDAQNAAGLTPLHLAAKQGNLLTLHLLLIYQADIHTKDKEGHTPLDYINEKQHTDQLQQLLQHTPWDAIASERDPFVLAWLLAAEKTRTKDNQGWTPLHLAACLGQMKAMQDLIANKADIEAKNSNGWTPLHLAAFLGQSEAIQVLLDHQASTNVIDHKGRTPYDLAASEVVKQLLTTHTRRMSLAKLIFQGDYGNIDIQILKYLTNKTCGQLRATCIPIGWRLLQQGTFRLQVKPAKLRHICPSSYPRLYPHERSQQDGSLTFHPIPADAVVRGGWDWQYMANDERLLIKNVVFIGRKVRTLQQLRQALPEHLIKRLIVSEKILDKEKEIPIREKAEQVRKKARKAAPEAPFSSAKPAVEEEPIPMEEEAPSENPYFFFPDLEPKPIPRESADPRQEEASSENPYQNVPEEILAEEPEYSSSEETIPADIANQLYDSFVGVKKLPAGKVTIGGYLAEGAFCKVFRGQWGNKAVALKQIDLKHTAKERNITLSEVKEAMQWEVTRLSTVSHPNLVQFYGLYQDGNEGYTYMVMEFCEGGTLQDKLEKADVPWPQRWQWALQISEVLAYLHQEGVLHRDLKAENVLLDKNGRAKLADLGLAQVDALLQEKATQIVEKGLQDKRFIAPEVETDPTLSTKATDIYALGLVFWQIATGKEPRRIDALNQYRQEEWRGGRERETIPDDCPKGIRQLILDCWEKDPNQRPTAQGVLAKLAALGPELDPYHHPLVTAAQKLEQLVHPKRKEGRAYIPPFVTQYSVDESIETYWNRIEAAKAKAEEESAESEEESTKSEEETAQAKEEADPNPPLSLAETFKKFIETPKSNTLLLLGEAGLGKTLTTYQWGDQLLEQWWAHINTGTPAPAYFPLFIRPELPTWSHAGIKDAFQGVARKYNLPKGIQPLVFIDGYDELQHNENEEPTNLVEHLGLSETGHPKLIVTCRPRTVEQSAQGARFGFNGALTTRHFLSFSLEQLLNYLHQELSWEKKVYQDYKNALDGAESVRTVLRNPFVLHLFRESWETLSQRPLRELNRWQIYEGFMAHILQVQQPLLSKAVQKRLQGSYPDLLSSYQAFMSEIAWQSFQQKGITLEWEKAKGISPWAQVKQYAEKVAKDEFAQWKAKQQKALAAAQGQAERRSLLSEDDYVRLTQKKVGQVEGELPLQLRGEGKEKRYEYSHKSLFEYGMAKRLLLLRNSPNIVEEGIGLLNSRKIQEEPEALQFWQEGWKEPRSQKLIEPLFALITRSRDEEAIQQASANSATLLAQAQVAFSGRALPGVRLPGADLIGALLSYTCLEGAQLSGAILRDAYLGNADLRGANLSGVDFGQYPSLKCKRRVSCLGYHPAGTQLAVGLDNGDIELYNIMEEAYTPIATLKGHTGWVMSVTYRPDGQQLASGGEDNKVGLWDPRQQLFSLLKGHTDMVSSVCYRPDGQQLASGSYDKTVGLWDPYRQQLITQLEGHSGRVYSVSYRPDGQQLASGSKDKMVGLWDPSQQFISWLKGHTGWVMSVTYRPDGQQLASGSEDKTIGLWDPYTQQLISQLKGHTGRVYTVSYRPDGQQLASGSDDKTVGLWNPHRQQLISQLKGHTDWVNSVTYCSDGQQLASGSYDGTVSLWDSHRQRVVRQGKGHSAGVLSVAYRPDGHQLASGSYDKMVGLWDPHRLQHLTLLKGHTGRVTYRPDGQQLALGGYDMAVWLWDLNSLKPITQLKGSNLSIYSVAYRPDGQQLASTALANMSHRVWLWDLNSLQLITQLQGHTGTLSSVTYRPDSQQLASGSDDKTVGLWDLNSLQLITRLKGHTSGVLSVAYHPDGQQLASGSKDKMIGLWDPYRQQLISLLKGHSGGVNSVTYRPDGQQLASGSQDKTVGLWHPHRQELITLLKGHNGSVNSVAYRPDGQQLASGSGDGAIFVWAKQDIDGLGPETWLLIHRFENTSSLSAPKALLKGATISEGNRALLEQKGASGDNDDQDLHKAAQEGRVGIIQTLIQSKANLETMGKEDHTPLHKAAENGHTTIVHVLLQHRANIEAVNKDNNTPLHIIAKRGHKETMETLIQYGANIDTANKKGCTPLHIAAKNGYKEMAGKLLQHGANVDTANKKGCTPLCLAAKNGYQEMVEALIQHRANIDVADKNGCTPLHLAIYTGKTQIVEALIQARANVDAANKDGWTPLHITAALNPAWQTTPMEVIPILLQAGANIEATEENGCTLLYLAAEKGQIDSVKYLLRQGANKDVINKEGKKPYDVVPSELSEQDERFYRDKQSKQAALKRLSEIKSLLSPGE